MPEVTDLPANTRRAAAFRIQNACKTPGSPGCHRWDPLPIRWVGKPRFSASRSQLSNLISIKALRFEVAGCPLWSEGYLFAVTGIEHPGIEHWFRGELAAMNMPCA